MPDDPRPAFTPDWPTCTVEGCRGIQVDGTSCLLHSPAREEFLADLHPGADLDLRGTVLSSDLFGRIVERFRAGDELAHYGTVSFSNVWFTGDAHFELAMFEGYARFPGACFSGNAGFGGAYFKDGVDFDQALFNAADLHINVVHDAHFRRTRFVERAVLTIHTTNLEVREAQFAKGVTLRVLGGSVDATDAVFGEPTSIIGHSDGRSPAELISLRRVDVRGLVLIDVGLGRCVFDGAHGLDQLRLEGHCPFGQSRPRWWSTRRQMLAGELAWLGEWASLPPDEPVGPARLAGQYRSLRKSFEDSKNEAGAGDFYYGEMEMRRHSEETSRAERTILWFYWLFSGYGQRASRALAALFVVVATVTTLLTVWGQDFGLAARTAVGAVVFRADDADLTAAGEWTVLVARFLGPVLLALAALAVRARVKR